MKKQNKIAIVVTAYKIDSDVVARFFKYNQHDNIYCVTDAETPKCVTRIQCPEMPIFSITRASNIGINKAIIDGNDVIIKTDIDCIITDDMIDFCRNLKAGNGACFRYWHVKSPAELNHTKLDKRCIGTAVMHADDWLRINGYNEHMEGYGYDDGDLRRCAREAGIIFPTLKIPKVYHIWHEIKHNRDSINPLNRVKNIAARKKS